MRKLTYAIRYLLGIMLFMGSLAPSSGQMIRDFNASIQSPSVSSLGLFKEMPVSLFTGLPNVEIPIYNLHEGELNVPVKLSYHAGGFRSDLKPGIIGPNWSLQSSGVIQRKVKDRADDVNYYGYDGIPNLGISKYEAERYNYSGFYFNRDTLKTMMGTRWGQISFLNDLAFPLSSSNPLTNTLLGYRDTEPDEFSFSLPTGGGSFYLDIDGNWLVAADKNFKVELNTTFLEVPFKLPVTSKDKEGYSFNGAFGNNMVY